MDDAYSQDDDYYNSWVYQMSKYRNNQSGVKKEKYFVEKEI